MFYIYILNIYNKTNRIGECTKKGADLTADPFKFHVINTIRKRTNHPSVKSYRQSDNNIPTVCQNPYLARHSRLSRPRHGTA